MGAAGRGCTALTMGLTVILLPSAMLTPLDRRQLEYSALENWMAHVDHTIRHTRRVLRDLVASTRPGRDLSNGPLDICASAPASVIDPAQGR